MNEKQLYDVQLESDYESQFEDYEDDDFATADDEMEREWIEKEN